MLIGTVMLLIVNKMKLTFKQKIFVSISYSYSISRRLNKSLHIISFLHSFSLMLLLLNSLIISISWKPCKFNTIHYVFLRLSKTLRVDFQLNFFIFQLSFINNINNCSSDFSQLPQIISWRESAATLRYIGLRVATYRFRSGLAV